MARDRRASRGQLVAAIIVLVAILAIIVAFISPAFGAARGFVQAICGVIVLALPGTALAWSLRPEVDVSRMQVALSAGAFSLGIVSMGGLILNVLPFGLNGWSWLALGGLALFSLWALAPDRARGSATPLVLPFRARETIMLAAAVALVVVAIVVARIGAEATPDAFSQLWITRSPAAGVTARVGIQNDEGVASTYRLVLMVGASSVHSWSSITLAADERWSSDITEPVPAGSDLQALLFKSSAPNLLYRQVTLRGPVSSSSSASGSP